MDFTNFEEVVKFMGSMNKALYGVNPFAPMGETPKDKAAEMDENTATDGEHDDDSHEDEELEDHSECAGCATCEPDDEKEVVAD